MTTDDAHGRTSERLEATVRGRVQGVGFRWYVLRQAAHLGLTGWVANHRDGTVRVAAEGPIDRLDTLEAALRTGPAGAVIERLDVQRSPARANWDGFRIRSGDHAGD